MSVLSDPAAIEPLPVQHVQLWARKGSLVHKYIWEQQKEKMQVRCVKGVTNQAKKGRRLRRAEDGRGRSSNIIQDPSM